MISPLRPVPLRASPPIPTTPSPPPDADTVDTVEMAFNIGSTWTLERLQSIAASQNSPILDGIVQHVSALGKSGGVVVLSFDNEELDLLAGAAFAFQVSYASRAFFVHTVRVEPCFQGYGVGTRILRKVEEHVKRFAAGELSTLVTSFGPGVEGFFLGLGYKPVGVEMEAAIPKDHVEGGVVTHAKVVRPPTKKRAPPSCVQCRSSPGPTWSHVKDGTFDANSNTFRCSACFGGLKC